MIAVEPTRALEALRRVALGLAATTFAALVGLPAVTAWTLAIFALAWQAWETSKEATRLEWDATTLKFSSSDWGQGILSIESIDALDVGSVGDAFLFRIYPKGRSEALEIDAHAVIWPRRRRAIDLVRHVCQTVPARPRAEELRPIPGPERTYRYAIPERLRQAIYRSVPSSGWFFAFCMALGACLYRSITFPGDAMLALLFALLGGWLEWRVRSPYRLAAEAVYDRVTFTANGLVVTRGGRSWKVSGPCPESTFGIAVAGRRWKLYRDAKGRPYYFDPSSIEEESIDSPFVRDLTQPR